MVAKIACVCAKKIDIKKQHGLPLSYHVTQEHIYVHKKHNYYWWIEYVCVISLQTHSYSAAFKSLHEDEARFHSVL